MTDDKEAFNNAFAALGGLRGDLPRGEEPPPKAEVTSPSKPPPARAVVRRERKGRRGKEVTLVEKLGLLASEAEEWLRGLKRELGCGGALEGDVLVFQGDQRKRLRALLEERGVRKVTMA